MLPSCGTVILGEKNQNCYQISPVHLFFFLFAFMQCYVKTRSNAEQICFINVLSLLSDFHYGNLGIKSIFQFLGNMNWSGVNVQFSTWQVVLTIFLSSHESSINCLKWGSKPAHFNWNIFINLGFFRETIIWYGYFFLWVLQLMTLQLEDSGHVMCSPGALSPNAH